MWLSTCPARYRLTLRVNAMADFLREGGITRLSRLDDGRVACCVCFGYVPREGLEPVEDEPGRVWDMCRPCAAAERAMATEGRKQETGGDDAAA